MGEVQDDGGEELRMTGELGCVIKTGQRGEVIFDHKPTDFVSCFDPSGRDSLWRKVG